MTLDFASHADMIIPKNTFVHHNTPCPILLYVGYLGMHKLHNARTLYSPNSSQNTCLSDGAWGTVQKHNPENALSNCDTIILNIHNRYMKVVTFITHHRAPGYIYHLKIPSHSVFPYGGLCLGSLFLFSLLRGLFFFSPLALFLTNSPVVNLLLLRLPGRP